MKVTQDVAALLQNFNGLSNLVSLVEKLGKIDIMNLLDNKELLRTIQKILTDDGPDAILKEYVHMKCLNCFGSLGLS
ncbi:hypothetical protein DPMN_036650 [Dreissena polymorpha]|uniref:Uncharacterized protein n=1 Tax=Dreissena polymorpha TaxID=45954 RepID=A0A9D4MBX5_DREPO|nr:hypothetical protein DPMN_036650 [Dreissena polymorpha]